MTLLSGSVLATADPDLSDTRLSLGYFFNLAKHKLNVGEKQIKLAIRRDSWCADSAGGKFFALQAVQDEIGERGEVKITVIRTISGHVSMVNADGKRIYDGTAGSDGRRTRARTTG